MGIIHGTLETGPGCAASGRVCRSSVFLRSSSRQLAMNRTAPCSTIPLHTWSLHAASNQPSSGIPNAFRSSFRHSHHHFTFRPRFFSTRPTFLNVPYNRRFGNLWLPIRWMRPASSKRRHCKTCEGEHLGNLFDNIWSPVNDLGRSLVDYMHRRTSGIG